MVQNREQVVQVKTLQNQELQEVEILQVHQEVHHEHQDVEVLQLSQEEAQQVGQVRMVRNQEQVVQVKTLQNQEEPQTILENQIIDHLEVLQIR